MHTLKRKGEFLALQFTNVLAEELKLPLPMPATLNCFDNAIFPWGPMRTWGISNIVTVLDWNDPLVLALPTVVALSKLPKGPPIPNTLEMTPRLSDVEEVSALKLPEVEVLIVGS